MIALEWNVGALRQRGAFFEELAPNEQLVVLTHYYKRTSAPTFDATTFEAATALDLVHVQRTLNRRKAPGADAAEGTRDAIARVTEALGSAARVPRGD